MSFRIEKDGDFDYLFGSKILGNVAGVPPSGVEIGDYIFWGTNSWQLGRSSINIGAFAGQTGTRDSNIAIGNSAGNHFQGVNAIAVGLSSATTHQGDSAIAIGQNAGRSTQSLRAISIGINAGRDNQGTSAICIGNAAALEIQGQFGVAIGLDSGRVNQGTSAVSIGNAAGRNTQGQESISIGTRSGFGRQGTQAISIGIDSAFSNQGTSAIAIGSTSGSVSQGQNGVAIGTSAGQSNQGTESVCIGFSAGIRTQGQQAVAIGSSAGGFGQGTQAIAIGFLAAPTSQTAGSIAINASGVALAASQAGFFARPVRSTNLGAGVNIMSYDTATFEIVQNTSKTFIIPHPFDGEKYLVHACLEGPEAGVYQRGSVIIPDGSKSARVELPRYMRAFSDFTVQVTKVVDNFEDVLPCGATKVVDGAFSVFGFPGEYNYTVQAKRETIEVEPIAANKKVLKQGPYTWFE